MEDDELDFNFWPAFADMMLALVLVLVLALFLVAAVITVGTIDLGAVGKNQEDMINSIASSYGTKAETIAKGVVGISINKTANHEIEISNELDRQRITLS